jgi:indolepyruvate ferredoxin oxidoreductase beta subunit
MVEHVTNIVIAGLGGQGVLTASDILARAAFAAGHDVKKSEVHGMSQRGGAVASDIRYGRQVLSPMVPPAAADVLVLCAEDQLDAFRHRLAPQGLLIAPSRLAGTPAAEFLKGRSANIALMGALARRLDLPRQAWDDALAAVLPTAHLDANRAAFTSGFAVELS